MPIARDTFLTRNSQNNNNWTGSYTVTGTAPALIVYAEGGAGNTATAATYNGVAMTKINAVNCYTTVWIASFILINPATGSNTLSISFSEVSNHSVTAASYTGVASGAGTGGSDSDSSFTWPTSGVNRSVTTTTVSNNCWISAYLRANGGPYANGTNVTIIDDPSGVAPLADTNGPMTPAGATTQTFVNANGNTDGGILSVALKPAVTAYSMSVTVGTFVLTGFSAILSRMKVLLATTRAYIFTGNPVNFVGGGWTNQSMNSSSFTNQTKNSSTYTNQTGSSSNWVNDTKH